MLLLRMQQNQLLCLIHPSLHIFMRFLNILLTTINGHPDLIRIPQNFVNTRIRIISISSKVASYDLQLGNPVI